MGNTGKLAFFLIFINMVAWFVLDTFIGADGANIISNIYIATMFLGAMIYEKE